MITRFRGAGVVAVLLLLAGCAAPAPVPADAGAAPGDEPSSGSPNSEPETYVPDLEGVSPEQEAELSDGAVTTDEYHAGFRRYEACLAAAGYQLRDYAESPDGFISAGIPDAAVSSGIDRECYIREWMQVDIVWQLANADNSPSTQFKRDCLITNGIEPGGNAEEIQAQWDEAKLDPAACG